MNVIQLMVTIIIVTILVTVILGVVSYVAYWLRRMRRPAKAEEVEADPRFFFRYVPEDELSDETADADEEAEEAAVDERELPVVAG